MNYTLPIILVLALYGFSGSMSLEKPHSSDTNRTISQRLKMVETQIEARGISDGYVLKAMKKIPRHLFVDSSLEDKAYGDHPLPISDGQTISQPYVVALMTEALKLEPGDKVLEIGTGSGYQAAVLAELVKKVYSIEIREGLKERAAKLLFELGYRNVFTKYADGYHGWEEHAPYDAIIITASANHIPPPLIKQLKDGGRLIIPLGSTLYYQTLTIVTKKGDKLEVSQMGGVSFVPMTGKVRK